MNKPKTVLICGGAKSVFEDIDKAKNLVPYPNAIIAVNDVLAELPHVDFFVSMHPTKVTNWLKQRRDKGYADPKSYWTVKDRAVPRAPRFETHPNTRGGSGLLAVFVARYLGYQRIILCGIPMTTEGGHFFNEKKWTECHIYRTVWENMKSLKDDTRSVSGWTMEHLGAPSYDWVNY